MFQNFTDEQLYVLTDALDEYRKFVGGDGGVYREALRALESDLKSELDTRCVVELLESENQ